MNYQQTLAKYHTLSEQYERDDLRNRWLIAEWLAEINCYDTASRNMYAVRCFVNGLMADLPKRIYTCPLCGKRYYTKLRPKGCKGCGSEAMKVSDLVYVEIVDTSTVEIKFDARMDEQLFTSKLTKRERQIYKLAKAGFNQTETAELLGVTKQYVNKTITTITGKFDNFDKEN